MADITRTIHSSWKAFLQPSGTSLGLLVDRSTSLPSPCDPFGPHLAHRCSTICRLSGALSSTVPMSSSRCAISSSTSSLLIHLAKKLLTSSSRAIVSSPSRSAARMEHALYPCEVIRLHMTDFLYWPRMSMAVIAGNLAFFPLSGRAINLRFEHPIFHPIICYFKGLFACATSRATINVPPDQCYERVLAQAFWVLYCLSQVTEYRRTIATLPLVTASLILGLVAVSRSRLGHACGLALAGATPRPPSPGGHVTHQHRAPRGSHRHAW